MQSQRIGPCFVCEFTVNVLNLTYMPMPSKRPVILLLLYVTAYIFYFHSPQYFCIMWRPRKLVQSVVFPLQPEDNVKDRGRPC